MADVKNKPAAMPVPEPDASALVVPAGAAPKWDLRLILALLALVCLGAVLTIQILEYRFYSAAPSVWSSPAAN